MNDKKSLCFVPFFDFKVGGKIVNISFFNDYNVLQDFYKCEAKTEAFVLALILSKLGFIELDDGYLSGECNVGEEEIEEIDFDEISSVILGEHLSNYDDFDNILKLAKFLCQKINADLYLGQKKLQTNEIYQTNEILSIASNLDSKSCDGLYVYSCLDEDEFRCSEQFLNLAKFENNEKLGFMKINCIKDMQGTIALSSKKAFKAYELLSLSEVKNANNN